MLARWLGFSYEIVAFFDGCATFAGATPLVYSMAFFTTSPQKTPPKSEIMGGDECGLVFR